MSESGHALIRTSQAIERHDGSGLQVNASSRERSLAGCRHATVILSNAPRTGNFSLFGAWRLGLRVADLLTGLDPSAGDLAPLRVIRWDTRAPGTPTEASVVPWTTRRSPPRVGLTGQRRKWLSCSTATRLICGPLVARARRRRRLAVQRVRAPVLVVRPVGVCGDVRVVGDALHADMRGLVTADRAVRLKLSAGCQRPSCGPRWWPRKSPHPSG
jgi:hypothetical protein